MADIIPPVDQDPNALANIDPYFGQMTNPLTSIWWQTQTITGIPANTIGWMLAQGWIITSVESVAGTNPPTVTYSMTKEVLDSYQALAGMLNNYTKNYNDAAWANNYRYSEVIEYWAATINNQQEYFETQATDHNAHVTVYLNNLDTYMTEVDGLIDANQSQLLLDAAAATTALSAFDTKLDELETNANANAATIDALLTTQAGYLTTFLAAFAAKLAELDTNYTSHLGNITTLLTASDTDLATFAASQSTQTAALSAAYTAHVTELESLLTTADTYLTTVSTDIDAVLSSADSDYTTLDTDITAQLTLGTTALGTHVTDYETVLDVLETDYTTIATALDAERTSAGTALTTHKADYNTEINKLEPDHDSHEITATNYLLGLGATELARINEKFAASLATQLQQLTDMGVYSSGRAVDVTARNTRDKNEEVAALNDRLMREKWENQHRVYEQQQGMRSRVAEGKDRLHGIEQGILQQNVAQITSRFNLQQSAHDRTMAGTDRLHAVKQSVYQYQATQISGLYQFLQANRDRTLNAKTSLYSLRDANAKLNIATQSQLYEAGQTIKQRLIEEAARLQQLEQAITQWQAGQRDKLLAQVQEIEVQNLAGLDKQHGAQQDVSRVAMGERDTLLAQLQDAVKGILSGKERYAALTMQNASTLAEHKHRAVVEKMNEFATRLEGSRYTQDADMKLMAYQLDEQNKLLIGLYGFVERRDDVGPSFEDLAKITTALGDSGGGWITP